MDVNAENTLAFSPGLFDFIANPFPLRRLFPNENDGTTTFTQLLINPFLYGTVAALHNRLPIII